MNDLRVVLVSLKARLVSTLITSGSVAVAVALLLTMLSLRSAGFEAFQRFVGGPAVSWQLWGILQGTVARWCWNPHCLLLLLNFT